MFDHLLKGIRGKISEDNFIQENTTLHTFERANRPADLVPLCGIGIGDFTTIPNPSLLIVPHRLDLFYVT